MTFILSRRSAGSPLTYSHKHKPSAATRANALRVVPNLGRAARIARPTEPCQGVPVLPRLAICSGPIRLVTSPKLRRHPRQSHRPHSLPRSPRANRLPIWRRSWQGSHACQCGFEIDREVGCAAESPPTLWLGNRPLAVCWSATCPAGGSRRSWHNPDRSAGYGHRGSGW